MNSGKCLAEGGVGAFGGEVDLVGNPAIIGIFNADNFFQNFCYTYFMKRNIVTIHDHYSFFGLLGAR